MTVTNCGALQLVGVKVKLETFKVPSEVSLLLRPMVTSAVGCELSTMEKESCPPASVVVKPLVGLTVIPALSSSTLITETLAGSMPS